MDDEYTREMHLAIAVEDEVGFVDAVAMAVGVRVSAAGTVDIVLAVVALV